MGASRRTIRETVASKLGKLQDVYITSVDGMDTTLLNVLGLSDYSGDIEHNVDSVIEWLSEDGTTAYWRRITAVSLDMSQVSINRAFDPAPDPDQPAHIYQLLNITEWNDAINEVLVPLYFHEREAIDLDDDSTDYTYELPAWVQTRGHVIDLIYRDTARGTETPVPGYKIIETQNVLSVKLFGVQPSATSFELILVGLRYYPRLLQEDWGTSCPTPLWQAGVEVAALHKVMHKYGQRFKGNYAQDLAIAEREFMKARAAVLPIIQSQEYNSDEEWDGPDVDDYIVFGSGGWY